MLPPLDHTPTADSIHHALAQSVIQLPRNEHRDAAVGMLLRVGASGLEMMFIQRAEQPDDPWSGHIAFPGGMAEPEDADLVATCRREALEEVHLSLEGDTPVNAQYLGDLDELEGRRGNKAVKIIIACSVFMVEDASGARPNYEIGRIDWVPLNYLTAAENQSEINWPFSDDPYPCVNLPYADLQLWGLTYRFVAGFLGKLASPPTHRG